MGLARETAAAVGKVLFNDPVKLLPVPVPVPVEVPIALICRSLARTA